MGGHVAVTCRITLKSTVLMRCGLMSNYFDHLLYGHAHLDSRTESQPLLDEYYIVGIPQYSTALLLTGARRRDHITPILRQLHWLPVRQRVNTFKIAVLVFQCLTGQAPAYLADDCQLTTDVSTRRLRSTDTTTCVVRRSNNSFGDRCFAAAGPRLWNTLPLKLRHCDSLGQFKRLLKTYLFGGWDLGAL